METERFARVLTNAGNWIDGDWALIRNGDYHIIAALDMTTQCQVPAAAIQLLVPLGATANPVQVGGVTR